MASKNTVLLNGVDITYGMVRDILDLPDDVVLSSDLLKNKGLAQRLVLKYRYMFIELLSRGYPHIGDWAIAYKIKKYGYDNCLPYGDVYPKVLTILYLAWAFHLVKIKRSLDETSMAPLEVTWKGFRILWKVTRDLKKGRSVNYPVGRLKTYDDVRREWHEVMGPIMEKASREAAKKATEIVMREREFYDF